MIFFFISDDIPAHGCLMIRSDVNMPAAEDTHTDGMKMNYSLALEEPRDEQVYFLSEYPKCFFLARHPCAP